MIVPDDNRYILIRRRPMWRRLWNSYRIYRGLGIPVWRSIKSAWIVATCKPLTPDQPTERVK